MRLVQLLGLLLVNTVCLASAAPQDASADISSLSQCTLSCLMEVVPTVGCSILDIPCQCASKNLTGVASTCMIKNCTVAESLHLIKVDAVQCNRPHDSKTGVVKAVAIASAVVTFFMIFMRVFARLYTVKVLWWDDWFHIIAGVFVVPLTLFANLLAQNGVGAHLYDIDTDRASTLLLWFYLVQIFWATAILCVKLSILCLYLRIFPNYKFRIICLAMIVFLVLSWFILFWCAVFQCVPINAIWNLDIKNARCLSISDLAYANAAINIATEVVILIVPIPMLRTLRLTLSKKIGLYLLFGAGILVIIVAANRLPTLGALATFNDPTWNNVPSYLWSCGETAVVHTVAAAPAIRQLFVRVEGWASLRYGKKSDPYYGDYSSYPSNFSKGSTSKNGRQSDRGTILRTSSVTRKSTTVEKAMAEVELATMENNAAAAPKPQKPMFTPPFPQHGLTTTTITANAGRNVRRPLRTPSRTRSSNSIDNPRSANINTLHSRFSTRRSLSVTRSLSRERRRTLSNQIASRSSHPLRTTSSQDSMPLGVPSDRGSGAGPNSGMQDDRNGGRQGIGRRDMLNNLSNSVNMDRSFLSLSSNNDTQSFSSDENAQHDGDYFRLA